MHFIIKYFYIKSTTDPILSISKHILNYFGSDNEFPSKPNISGFYYFQ